MENIVTFAKTNGYELSEQEELVLHAFEKSGVLNFALGVNHVKLLQILEKYDESSIDKSDK
jgi:hypothetical protein